MRLYQEILAHYLAQQDAQILFPNLSADASSIIESECMQIVKKIQAIIANDSLDDPECFIRVEEIVSVLETHGIDCGTRHDFG